MHLLNFCHVDQLLRFQCCEFRLLTPEPFSCLTSFWPLYIFKDPSFTKCFLISLFSERAQICKTEIYLILVSLSCISAGTPFAFLFLPYCFPSESWALETARSIAGKLLQKHRIPGIGTLLPQVYKPRIKPGASQWRRFSLRKVFFCAHHNSICVLATWRNRDTRHRGSLEAKNWRNLPNHVAVTNQLGCLDWGSRM